MVGYYQEQFDSRVFFIHTQAVVFGPFPLLLLLQWLFDSYFDAKYSTNVTYIFRLMFSQLAVVAITLVWMFVSEPSSVLWVGAAIGAMTAVMTASVHQLLSAMDPGKLVWAELGMQIGSMAPIVVFNLLGFEPSASVHEFRLALLPVILANAMAMGVLFSLHLLKYFEPAYENLASARGHTEDLWRQGDAALAADGHGAIRDHKPAEPDGPEAAEDEGPPTARSLTEDGVRRLSSAGQGLAQSVFRFARDSQQDFTKRSVPRWVWLWLLLKVVATALYGCVTSLNSFFGSPREVQHLALVRLASEFLGRAMAWPVCRLHAKRDEVWHWLPITALGVNAAAAWIIFAKLAGSSCSASMFATTWAILTWMHRLLGTFQDVTVTSHVDIKDRAFVSRLVLLAAIGALMPGFQVAFFIVVPLLETHFPTVSGAALVANGFATIVARAGSASRYGLRQGRLQVS